MTATIGKVVSGSGVWCVFVRCVECHGAGVTCLSEPGPRHPPECVLVDCPHCSGSGQRVLSTHATRDGAATSANQINQAERDHRD